MKKILCSFCVLAMLSTQAQTWQPLGDPGFSSGNAENTTMVISKNGTPYVAYQDGFGGPATVMTLNGDSWQPVGGAGFSAGAAQFPSIAIDPTNSNVLYIAFQDGSKGNKASVMKYNGAGRVSVGSPGFSAASVQYTTIAIDGSGTPYVAYQDGDSGKLKATVMKYDGSNWVVVGSPKFSAGEVLYTSIAIDNGGTPYVVYEDGQYGPATVMEFYNGNWITLGRQGFSAGRVNYPSIIFDRWGFPYVSYLDGANTSKATVMTFNSVAWVPVGQAGFSVGQAYYISTAIDSNGIPYVAFSDNSDSNRITVMRYDPYTSAAWKTVGSVGFSSEWAWSTSIAIDGSGIPYVAYSDLGYDYKAVAMKLDTSVTSVKNTSDHIANSIAAFPNPNNGSFTINVSSSANENAGIFITNALGEKIIETTTAANKETQIQLNTSGKKIAAGIYFITAVTKSKSETIKITVE